MARSRKRPLTVSDKIAPVSQIQTDFWRFARTAFYCAFELLDFYFIALLFQYLDAIAGSNDPVWTHSPISLHWPMRIRNTYAFAIWTALIVIEPLKWGSAWHKRPMLQTSVVEDRSLSDTLIIGVILGMVEFVRILVEFTLSMWLAYTAYQSGMHAAWLRDHPEFSRVYFPIVACISIARLVRYVQTRLKKNPQHPFHKVSVYGSVKPSE